MDNLQTHPYIRNFITRNNSRKTTRDKIKGRSPRKGPKEETQEIQGRGPRKTPKEEIQGRGTRKRHKEDPQVRQPKRDPT